MFVRKKYLITYIVNNANLLRMTHHLEMVFKKKYVHCKCVLLFDNVVALIPKNEFQLLYCFYVHFLNKTTNIENQQC